MVVLRVVDDVVRSQDPWVLMQSRHMRDKNREANGMSNKECNLLCCLFGRSGVKKDSNLC